MASVGMLLQAQVQQGIVRTAGRSNHSGKVISDVIIRVEGGHNAVASGSDGTFSILFDGIQEGDLFRINSIRKPNYEVLDKGFIGRSLAFSSKVPMTIVLLDKTEMERERKEMAMRFEETYAANYERQVKAIEEQYEQRTLSLEQKIARLEDVNNLYEKIQSQMNEMIEHYLRTDYDVLDSVDREINRLIENGRFEEAREMILAKGDVNHRVQTVLEMQKQVEKNEKAIHNLQQRQSQLSSETQSHRENLLKDLHHLYDIAIADFKIDTAQAFMQQMLTIAPDDMEVLHTAASFEYVHRKSFLAALRYSQSYLNQAQQQYSDSSEQVLSGYLMVGASYLECYSLDSALLTYREALMMADRYSTDTLLEKQKEYIYKSMASVFENQKMYDSTLYYYDKATEQIRLHPSSDTPTKLAFMQYQLARLYANKRDYAEAFAHNRQALEMYSSLSDSSMISYCYYQQAYVYEDMDSLHQALQALGLSLQYTSVVSTHVTQLSNIYASYAAIYMTMQQYDSALVYVNKEMENMLRRYETHYVGYIFARFQRADIYAGMHRYEEALNDFNLGISDLLIYYKDSPSYAGYGYRDRGGLYEQIGEKEKAIADYQKAIEMFRIDPTSGWRVDKLEKKIQQLQTDL